MDYRREFAWGSFTPQFRVEYQHDLDADSVATMRYADLLDGPFYRTDVDGFDRNRFVLGLGAGWLTDRQLGLRLEYRSVLGDSGVDDQSLQLQVNPNVRLKYAFGDAAGWGAGLGEFAITGSLVAYFATHGILSMFSDRGSGPTASGYVLLFLMVVCAFYSKTALFFMTAKIFMDSFLLYRSVLIESWVRAFVTPCCLTCCLRKRCWITQQVRKQPTKPHSLFSLS